MERIFISYRRNDVPAASGRIYDHLVTEFGAANVFQDVDAIHSGEDFEARIRERLREATVMLVVIGVHWEGPRGLFRRSRVFDDGDWIRRELEIAKTLPLAIIPVLVDRPTLPQMRVLPGDLNYLPKLQALQLRHDRWRDDIGTLVWEIRRGHARAISDPRALVLARVREGGQASFEPATARIYVCYRVTDVPQVASHMIRELKHAFGGAIQDSSHVANRATDPSEQIRAAINEETLMLVVIGPEWIGAASASGDRRIDQEADYVRIGIEEAMLSGSVVIPILVDGARMPHQDELPSSLVSLSYRNALVLATGTDYDRLVKTVTQILDNRR